MSDISPPEPDKNADGGDALRWPRFFRRARDPLYLLDRRRTFLFVNRAWEELTGFPAATVLGTRCLRHRDAPPASLESLLTALAPPPETLGGQPARVRRPIPRPGTAPDWWDITFFPFKSARGRLGVLGKIGVVARPGAGVGQPLPSKLVALRDQAAQWYALDQAHTDLPAQRLLVEQVRLASTVDVPVTLIGEAGAGKHWTARAIHGQSKARERTFALIDCGRLPVASLTAVLFGEAGLCWRASVGTVYLREPSRLPRELQSRLAELLAAPAPAAGARRPRLIAGCRLDPAVEVGAGHLLEELRCALGTLTIRLAPLAQRQQDLPWLVQRMLGRLSAEREKPFTDLTGEAWALLQRHSWPGNLSELYAVLAGACARAKGERVEVSDFPWYLREGGASARKDTLPLKSLLQQAERRLIELALRQSGQNLTKAADLLAIWRPTLYERMKKLGIEITKE
ncbi:MAG TPA: sigma 54-interacting transcriptional regulator [Gemmataceae bacterium]|nr:sigma 54-interacting transcriptional regulator [Gemmataceae bacterium]